MSTQKQCHALDPRTADKWPQGCPAATPKGYKVCPACKGAYGGKKVSESRRERRTLDAVRAMLDGISLSAHDILRTVVVDAINNEPHTRPGTYRCVILRGDAARRIRARHEFGLTTAQIVENDLQVRQCNLDEIRGFVSNLLNTVYVRWEDPGMFWRVKAGE